MEIKETTKLDYDKVVINSNIIPLQTSGWAEVKSDTWKPRYFIISGEKELLPILLLEKKLPLLKKYFGYIPRILFTKNNLFNEGAIKLFIKNLKKDNYSHIIIDPDVDFASYQITGIKISDAIDEMLKNIGFIKLSEQIQPGRSVVIDLLNSEDQILQNMRSKHRQYIRKSQKNGFYVREGNGENIKDLYKIVKYLENTKGYKMHGKDYYQKIWDVFSKQNRAKIMLLYKENQIHGVYLFLLSNTNVYEMYGGCDTEGNKLLGSYLLKWISMKFFKKLGYKYYDQWGAEYKYPGLVQFKEGFGGFIVEYLPSYVYIYSKFSYKQYQLFYKLNKLIKGVK